ncbi:MAG: flagellar FlbD family protein [Synergistaceae bacterium]|jgi:flagellar protein FlbD|nr:flagellar FlbD family protein [Synergistaceae bacterium]
MIELHRLNGELFLLNSDMIETVEVTPDTVVRLINGHRYVVRESFDDIRNDMIDFRKKAGYTCIPSGMPLESDGPQQR